MDDMLKARGGNLGLLAEQVDAKTGAMLGNVPQALSHLALIHAAMAIDEGRRGKDPHSSDGDDARGGTAANGDV